MNIEKQINELAKLNLEADPRVVDAKKRLKDFEGKQADLTVRIAEMGREHAELEKQSARAMLNGKDAQIQRLTALANRKVEAETEHRILSNVIEQALARVKEIRAEVKREQDVQQLEVISTAYDEFINRFEPLRDAQAVLEKGLKLGAISRNDWLSDDLRNISRAYDKAQKFKQFIAELITPKPSKAAVNQ